MPEQKKGPAQRKSQKLSAAAPHTAGPSAPLEPCTLGDDAPRGALETQETTEPWDAPAREECKRRMKELGVPEAKLSALLALLTDPQSNIRPNVMRVDADLLECCTRTRCMIWATQTKQGRSAQLRLTEPDQLNR